MIHWTEKPSGLNPITASGYLGEYYFYFISMDNAAKIIFYRKMEGDADINNQYVVTKAYILLKKNAVGFLPKWMCRLLIYLACFKLIVSKKKPL